MSIINSQRPSIPSGVWAIGFSNFLINTSSVMIFSLSAVYLKTLGVESTWIGLLEGVVEATAFATRVFSGVVSDYLRRRKSVIMFGYGLVTLSRLIFPISSSFSAVFTARMFDRLGNGIQASPRDALVSDITPPEIKGECFGLGQTLKTAGSFFGAIVGLWALWLTSENFHQVFWIASIPAVLAFLLLAIVVKEPEQNLHPKDHQKRHPIHWSDIPRLGRPYWLLMLVVVTFMLARIGEAFLTLHARGFGLTIAMIPIIQIVYNATTSLSSYPIGWLSDRYSRFSLLALGIFTLILTDVIMVSSSNLFMVFIGVGMWGIQIGICQSLFLAMIADYTPEDLRGTAFGIFYLISAISILIAGTTAGYLAHIGSESWSYIYSGVVATISLILLGVIRLLGAEKSR